MRPLLRKLISLDEGPLVLHHHEPAGRLHLADDALGDDADAAFLPTHAGGQEWGAVQAEFVRHSGESG